MKHRWTSVTLLITIATIAGCSTCISVEGTYDEVWTATREALETQPDMGTPIGRYESGTMTATATRPRLTYELQYRVEIKPVGGNDREKRKVCVRVIEVDAPVRGLVGDQVEKVESTRREDIERSVTSRIEWALAATE